MKKLFSFIIIALCLVLLPVSKLEETSDDIGQQSLTRLSSTSLILALDDEATPFSIFELPGTELKADVSLESYDIILVNEHTVKWLKNDANHLLNSGKLIYYSNPKVSNEEIAQELSIPKDGISHVNPYEKIDTVIYKVNDSVVFANHYQTNTIENVEIPQDILLQNGLTAGLKGALELRLREAKYNE